MLEMAEKMFGPRDMTWTIRKLRREESCFKKMTADTFRQAGVAVSDDELKFLLSTFVRNPMEKRAQKKDSSASKSDDLSASQPPRSR